MKKYTDEQLQEILEKHNKWCMGKREPDGVRADLSGADLSGVDLSGARLRYAILKNAKLDGANLSHANLTFCNMDRADLRGADLTEAELNGAGMCEADLRRATMTEACLPGANLEFANLEAADLSRSYLGLGDFKSAVFRNANLSDAYIWDTQLIRADLSGSDLRGAYLGDSSLRHANLKDVIIDDRTKHFRMVCPEFGAYHGYKIAGGCLVDLLIPSDALRSSATSNKCRASKAVVLSIREIATGRMRKTVESDYDSTFIYEAGETVCVEDFSTDRWDECAPGIHHFLTKLEARNYY